MDNENYIKLAQFKAACFEYDGPPSALLEKTFKDDSIINYQIPATEYLKSKELELIGCTPLHIVSQYSQYNKIDYLRNLVDRGANFTIKNNAGQTALHKIIQYTENRYKKSWTLKGKLTNSKASLILSAHVMTNNFKNPCDNNSLSHFHIACMINHTEAIEFFLKSGVHINEPVHFNSPYLSGYTPLHIAARYSCYEAWNILLKHNADVNLRNTEGISPVHLLLERNMEIMDYIYMSKRAAYDHFKEEYDTNEKMIRHLIENNKTTDWNAVDDIGLSLFPVMCTLQDTSIINKLLKRNISLGQHVRIDSPVWPGYTALHFAAHSNFKTVRLLLKHGADIQSIDAKGNTPFDLCLKRFKLEDIFLLFMSQPDWEDIRFSNKEMRLADLVYAMRDKHLLSTVLQKVFKNVNVCIPHDSPLWPGFTPLHLAVVLSDKMYVIANLYENTDYNVKIGSKNYYNCDLTDDKLCRQRIDVCLDLQCDATSKDSHGSTPIHLAFPLMSSSTINLLLDSQKKISNPLDKNGLSHLHIACATNNLEFVKRLLSRKVDANGQVMFSYEFKRTAESQPLLISRGSTPLHIAVATKQIKLVRLLLKHDADRNAEDDNGLTPVHLLLKVNVQSTLRKEMGVDLLSPNSLKDLETSFGLNYLHVASYVDDAKAIERLLDAGANIEATIKLNSPNDCSILNNSTRALSFLDRYNGCTPLHLAMEHRNLTAATILLKRGANILAKKFDGPASCSNALKVNVQKIVLQTVVEDASFQKRIFEAVGLTLLHVACATLDVDRVDELLKNGADPNERLFADSPFWPGFTPLHCAMTGKDGDKIIRIAKSLFDHGADVTLTDQSGETTIHQYFNEVDYSLEGNSRFEFLLKHQKDYNVNPTDAGGVSHFHVACMCKDIAIVEEFLSHNVNVNLVIDHFSSAYGGTTPLHVALWNSSNDIANLLLKRGANVNLGDDNGNTPLHFAARHSHDLEGCFYSLISAGADVNATNVLGETPFEKLAESFATEEDIALFIEQGCRINSYNPSTQEGLIGKSLSSQHYDSIVNENAFYQTLIQNPNVNDFDELGRTPLHNIASSSGLMSLSDDDELDDAIRELVSAGYEINHQDKRGYTALHTAILFENITCTSGLLSNGADINIVDSTGKTALDYVFETESQLENYFLKEFSVHIFKLKLVDIYVNEANKRIYNANVVNNANASNLTAEHYYAELKDLKKAKLGTFNITLFDFLSETGAVAAYPNMSLDVRQAIEKYFVQNDEKLSKNQFYGLLQLQRRKALDRMNLVDSAKYSLDLLVGFSIPDLCSTAILRFLPNVDLKNLIMSSDDEFLPIKHRRNVCFCKQKKISYTFIEKFLLYYGKLIY